VSAQILRQFRRAAFSRENIPIDVYLRDVAPINIDRSNETEKLSKVYERLTTRKYILRKYYRTPIRSRQSSFAVFHLFSPLTRFANSFFENDFGGFTEKHYGSISARGNYIVCPAVFTQNELLLRSSCLFARACDAMCENSRESVIFVSVGENLVGRFKFSFKKTGNSRLTRPVRPRASICSRLRYLADNYEYRIALRVAITRMRKLFVPLRERIKRNIELLLTD